MSTLHKLTFFAWLFLLLTACQKKTEVLPTLTPAPTPLADLQAELEHIYPPYYNGLAVWGGYVYFGFGNELIWLDVRDPAQPILAGQLTLPNRVYHLKLQDGQIHVVLRPPDHYSSAGLVDGWQQVDLRDPSRPQLTTFYDSPIGINDVLIHKGIAYLAANAEIIRLDITDPTAPRTLAPITQFHGNLANLFLYESYLLASGTNCLRSCTTSLYLVDTRLPADPQIVTQYTQYGGYPTLIMHLPFVTHVGNGISTLDLRDPTDPQLVEEWAYGGYIFSALRQGNRLYTNDRGLQVFDLVEGQDPQPVAHLLSETFLDHLALDGNLLVTMGPEDGLFLFTLEGTAAAPRQVAHFQLPPNR